MKRFIIILLPIFYAFQSFANMASPVLIGALPGTVFSSRNVDILKEKLFIQIRPDIQKALIRAEYHIKSDSVGKQIPLLFHAADYTDGFQLWVDGVPVNVLPVPAQYAEMPGNPMSLFSNAFIVSESLGEHRVSINWSNDERKVYALSELHYVEVDWEQGEHIITVSYEASAWENRSDWVSAYKFRYSLSPAKYWRSFGGLELEISSPGIAANFYSNLGNPMSGSWDKSAYWSFKEIPAEYIEINVFPHVSKFASILIQIGPGGMFYILSAILVALHIMILIKYRKANPLVRFSSVLIIGVFLVPLLAILGLNFSYSLIDVAIGMHAARFHGYFFLSIFLYPIILPFYGLFVWFIDWALKRRLKSKM
ncbi:MAG: hypothetical protein IAE67_08055 [Candidatus Competibacteraceae bacterium]|nr:hypothetical protein [Candidatus Competibacteraceae bacterium]